MIPKNILCLILALCLSTWQALGQDSLDFRLLNRINGPEKHFSDGFNKGLSYAAAPISIGLPASYLGVGYFGKDPATRDLGWMMLGGMLLNQGLTASLKFGIQRDRPYVTYASHIYKKAKTGPFSFPSGHTSTAFATATLLSLSQPKWYVIAPSFLWAGGVAYSRMYLGVHFPSDILGGMVIGVCSSLIAWGVYKAVSR